MSDRTLEGCPCTHCVYAREWKTEKTRYPGDPGYFTTSVAVSSEVANLRHMVKIADSKAEVWEGNYRIVLKQLADTEAIMLKELGERSTEYHVALNRLAGTETRIAELEKQLDACRNVLKGQMHGPNDVGVKSDGIKIDAILETQRQRQFAVSLGLIGNGQPGVTDDKPSDRMGHGKVRSHPEDRVDHVIPGPRDMGGPPKPRPGDGSE